MKAFQDRHHVTDMVIVADAGMLSAANLKELDAAVLRFIVGSRLTKAPGDLASHFRWHGDAFTDGQVIDTLTPRHAGRHPENDPTLKAEPSWDPGKHPGSWRAVWAYSAKRAAQDGKTLTAQENRAKAVVAGERAARTPRVRHHPPRRPHPGRGGAGPGMTPGRAQGVRHEHPRHPHARR